MRFKAIIIVLIFSVSKTGFSQKSNWNKFMDLSGPEKCWVMLHPFVAKKALIVTEEVRIVTKEVMQEKLLKGNGNGGQVDAFRHVFWMANLTLNIGSNKAKSLGEAHEKGNYKDYKKGKLEDGVIPDKISSEMDHFNNDVGINIGEMTTDFDLKGNVVEAVKNGKCKIIKTDEFGGFLNAAGKVIPVQQLKGKWENEKCLVNSNE
jgi:hypothetical protein